MALNENKMAYAKLIEILDEQKIKTWFDMGIFLDTLKDNRKDKFILKTPLQLKKKVAKGIGFITFDYGIDGVSIEIAKYAKAFEKLFASEFSQKVPIHFIGGTFFKETDTILEKRWSKKQISLVNGFGDAWDGYNEMFHTRLARGSKQYNKLALKIWDQTKDLCREIGQYIIDEDIYLLVPVNCVSNPGNISLAYCIAILSEFMDIKVLASHHDFYWEDGKKREDRNQDQELGLRDHFFENAHIGEVFSLLEVLYPWDGPNWLHTTINAFQRETLIGEYGMNPISIKRMPTSINLKKYRGLDSNERKDVLKKLNLMFSSGDTKIIATNIFDQDIDCSNIGHLGCARIFAGERNIEFNFRKDNLLFLQPTRIIKRKRIELDFVLVESFLKNKKFAQFFNDNEHLSLTVFITGPIANGNDQYFNYLISEFKSFIERVDPLYKRRIFLACSFGLENKQIIRDCGLTDVSVEQMYGVASLTLLPSKTEGRGLPIIESCSSGVPIVCNRYTPEYVFSDVIGENLSSDNRFKVFEFTNQEFTDELIEELTYLFIDPTSMRKVIKHNRNVVKKRFSNQHLIRVLDSCLLRLWQKALPEKKVIDNVINGFKVHKKISKKDKLFQELVVSKNRSYLPGYSYIEYMILLKSLIDPSFFRNEEMLMRGRIMMFAEKLMDLFVIGDKYKKEDRIIFYKHLDVLFSYYKGKDQLAIDHSLSYRHRHRRHYPFRKLTEQELCGVVGIIFRNVFKGRAFPNTERVIRGHFKNLKSAIMQLIGTTNDEFAIDFSKRLANDLLAMKSVALFPGFAYKLETNIFVLNVFKSRMGISLDEDLTKEVIKSKKDITPKIYIFLREHPLDDISYDSYLNWLETKALKEIKCLYDYGLLEVIKASNISSGVHLGQLDHQTILKLLEVKDSRGIVISSGENSFMLDMIDIDSYRFGKVKNFVNANFMGLSLGDSYLQWVPAGLKPSLAYPTPIQTPKDFADVLQSPLYDKCVKKFGERGVLSELRDDADQFGSPIKNVLTDMIEKDKSKSLDQVYSTPINGIYDDDLPWSGAFAKIELSKSIWSFYTQSSGAKGKTVLKLIKDFEKSKGSKVSFAWNGGYILNNELVGKLGLPEAFIGSPLGFMCENKKILSLPLYNKAAFLIDKNGAIRLERINLNQGLEIKFNDRTIICKSHFRNSLNPENNIAYYDLMYEKTKIIAKDRIIYRFVGNSLIEIIDDQLDISVLPVGMTLSVPKSKKIKNIKVGDIVDFKIYGLEDVTDAIEAGPMLVQNGKVSIDMELEGWKSDNSIATQAARLDYLDMRGPKIGVGLSDKNELLIIAINGRIRESVGATHVDLANTLIKYGAKHAMGFDPGGSVTLVIGKKQLNISPYNPEYESNIYSLKPTPRIVGNAILGTPSN